MGVPSFRTAAASLALVSLSACGGSATGGGPLEIRSGVELPEYDPETGVLSAGGVPIAARTDETISSFANADVTRRNNGPGSFVYQARSETGGAFAVTYADIGGDDPNDYGTIYGRDAVPDAHRDGQTTYTGSYAGLSIRDPDGVYAFSAAVTGLANLTVDYDRNNVVGLVSQRRVVSADGVPFSNPVGARNMILNVSDLNENGTFEGVVVNGEFTQAGATFTPRNGRYEGFIADNATGSGEAIAGIISLSHFKSDGNTYLETGVFTVN